MSDEVQRITVEGCKYTVVINGGDMHALRYGERWKDLTGDKFVYCLATELQAARRALAAAQAAKDVAAKRWTFAYDGLSGRIRAVEPNGTVHSVARGDMNTVAGRAMLDAMVRDLTRQA